MATIETPDIPEAKLPKEYEKPYEDTCKKIKTRYGEFSDMEFQ
jgi:hypothetical protein